MGIVRRTLSKGIIAEPRRLSTIVECIMVSWLISHWGQPHRPTVSKNTSWRWTVEQGRSHF